MFKFGLEILQAKPQLAQGWGRCALLCNQASLTSDFAPAWEVMHQVLGPRLKAFLSPQHGFHATVQDNMIETEHAKHPIYQIPIYSLYSETREPTPAMLQDIDTIVIDIQIVGCRVYTFKYTIAACLRAAKKLGKRVVILDRPNPMGGVMVEGRVLDLKAKSFVGEFPIPMRHGLTAAEAARLFNKDIGAELSCIGLESWQPEGLWHEVGRHWIITSPNLPTADSVYVYPGTVMLEGTNISEGRGTTLPFQFVGAPYIHSAEAYAEYLTKLYQPQGDVYFRATEFQPTSQKWQGQVCRGVQIHVLNGKTLRTYDLGLAVIRAAAEMGADKFQWKQPPYEYDFSTLPIKLILGELAVDQWFADRQFSVRDAHWHTGLKSYIQAAEGILLYDRQLKSFH